jgi:hypothetical protein
MGARKPRAKHFRDQEKKREGTKMRQFLATTAMAALLAGPVTAQEAAELCGGLGAQGAWIGGSAETSDVNTLSGPADQLAILPQDRSQISLFTLSEPGAVRLEAAPQAGGDTFIELRAADGALIMSDDDGGGGLASRIEMMLDPGSYCLITQGLGGSAVTADIRIGRPEHPALTAGSFGGDRPAACTMSTPTAAMADGPVDAALDAGLSVTAAAATAPFHAFTLDAPAAVTLRAENESADPVLMLYDQATGMLIAENDDYDGLNSQIDVTDALDPGTYCIALQALSDGSQPITVSLRRFDPERAMLELYARGEASPPVGGPVPIEDLGLLSTRVVRDAMVGADTVWFSFVANEGGLVLIDAVALGHGDPEVILFDELGREVGRDDDGGGSLNSRLAAPISAGTYVIALRQYDSSPASSAMRLAAQRFVPAE